MATISRIYDLRGSQTTLTIKTHANGLIEVKGELYPAPQIGDYIVASDGMRYLITATGTEGKRFWAFVKPRGLV